MHSATSLSRGHLKHSIEVIKTMEELLQQQQKLESALLRLSERLTSLDQRISQLERPRLMYRRPSESKHESLSDTLDYLHNNIEGLKGDLVKISQSVSY